MSNVPFLVGLTVQVWAHGWVLLQSKRISSSRSGSPVLSPFQAIQSRPLLWVAITVMSTESPRFIVSLLRLTCTSGATATVVGVTVGVPGPGVGVGVVGDGVTVGPSRTRS